jgi:hypothetical protein
MFTCSLHNKREKATPKKLQLSAAQNTSCSSLRVARVVEVQFAHLPIVDPCDLTIGNRAVKVLGE